MPKIDNFSIIKSLLSFDSDDDFYFGQIIQRRKDIVALGYPANKIGPDNKVIKDLYFKSIQEFDEKQDDIIKICHALDARAYININKRSKCSVALRLLTLLSDRLERKEYGSLRSIYATACGSGYNRDGKKWIVDIDFKTAITELEKESAIKRIEDILSKLRPVGNKTIAKIPTKSGLHLITSPFDSKTFCEQVNDIDIHKNNPTLLYLNF